MSHKLESIQLDDLLVQENYNARTDKEVNDNAKEIAAHMEATGDHREDFVVKYVEQDGTKYTRNHATVIAAKLRGWDEVLARKSPHVINSAEDHLDLIYSNNSAHPISRALQGRIYVRLRDGIEEDQSEAIKNAAVGEVIETKYLREPLSIDEIAALCKPARTKQHIADCIAIYESPEDIAQLLENGKTSANPVLKAKQWAKGDEAKWKRIVKRAIAYAREQGKETATQQHFDAIKSEFVELKADRPDGEKPASSPAKASKSKNKGDAASDASDDSQESSETSESVQPAQALQQAEAELFTEGTPKNDKMRKLVATVLAECSDEYSWAATDEDLSGATDKLLAALQDTHVIF